MTGVVTARQLDWSTAIEDRINAVCHALAEHLPVQEVARVEQACRFAAAAHDGVYRKTGEPYIFHPLAVLDLLNEVRLDHQTLMAAVLHDVIEDTPHGKDELSRRFGQEVADLVDGVSKLTQMSFESRLEAQAENFRKMFLAMAHDIRVIMIKLADRLHNMRTLDAMLPAKRRRIARETLDIYAPIANRLGMNHLRLELEDLGFRHLYPHRYQVLCHAMQQRSARRSAQIMTMEAHMREHLHSKGLNVRVVGREKPLWRTYRSLYDRKLRFRNMNDVYSVRIIVDDIDACYRALGGLHHLHKPVIGRFRDYIALPKANGYQSLHTVLFGPQGVLLEVRIRTYNMHVMAQTGIASYWLHRTDDQQHSPRSAQERARDWLKKLLDMQRRAGNSVEFLESVKVDLFPNDIFVFTPTGEIIELPRGATAVDFAYAIHSDVGNTCLGAKIDNRFVPLRTRLSSGQAVEVIISPTARPDPAWLSFVVTAKARASIRHYLTHLKQDEAIVIGRRLLENALPSTLGRLENISSERITALLTQLKLNSLEDLLADIGLGRRLAPLIAKLLAYNESAEIPIDNTDSALLIKGTEGSLVSFGKCCRPIPGDHIIGHLSAERGIVIHRDNCSNVAEFEKAPDKWLEVQWENEVEGDFPVAIRLELQDQRWVFAKVTAIISEMGANIDTIHTSKRETTTTIVDLIVNVSHRDHLALILRRLHGSPGVLRITRRQ